jgi:hypothetical protein
VYSLKAGSSVYKSVLAEINQLPTEEPPALFGFHQGANLNKNKQEMRSILNNLLRMGEVHGL